tara:strand:- start:3081 stop:3284 length:204 start_codon:yes stop_codon:yes gene_type:complete
MIRTKFTTTSLTNLIELMDEFETKLHVWSEENMNATWDLDILIGDYEYHIIVTVENEEDNDTNKLEL